MSIHQLGLINEFRDAPAFHRPIHPRSSRVPPPGSTRDPNELNVTTRFISIMNPNEPDLTSTIQGRFAPVTRTGRVNERLLPPPPPHLLTPPYSHHTHQSNRPIGLKQTRRLLPQLIGRIRLSSISGRDQWVRIQRDWLL